MDPDVEDPDVPEKNRRCSDFPSKFDHEVFQTGPLKMNRSSTKLWFLGSTFNIRRIVSMLQVLYMFLHVVLQKRPTGLNIPTALHPIDHKSHF